MTFKHIEVTRERDVMVIRMADEKSLNAISLPMVEEISAAFDDAAATARAVILTGSGRAFSSGANITGGIDPEAHGYDVGLMVETHYNPLMLKLYELPIPIVTAINGLAAGIGCSFAIMGDISVAAESSYFLQAFRGIGLIPDGGATWMLPRSIGKARAMEMMLLGGRIPAATALDWGLINRVVPDGAVMQEAMTLATNLAAGPTRALAMTRKLVWAGLDTDFAAQLHRERVAQRDAGHTSDHREGLKAFWEKRPSAFTGR
jgi:2-(1,2-epoxy-1,2-dihydrophenyl)acetyl-CoA isomerase